MWKKLAIGCCVVAALGVAAVVSMISMFPKVLGFVREEVGDELERQSIAAAWLAPAEGATPETIFPARVDEYRIESTAEGVSVPALGIDERGAHATYASDASGIDVHAFSVTKREADVGEKLPGSSCSPTSDSPWPCGRRKPRCRSWFVGDQASCDSSSPTCERGASDTRREWCPE